MYPFEKMPSQVYELPLKWSRAATSICALTFLMSQMIKKDESIVLILSYWLCLLYSCCGYTYLERLFHTFIEWLMREGRALDIPCSQPKCSRWKFSPLKSTKKIFLGSPFRSLGLNPFIQNIIAVMKIFFSCRKFCSRAILCYARDLELTLGAFDSYWALL